MTTKLDLQAMNIKLTEQLCTANSEISFLRAKLAERDQLARRLIKAGNPNKPVSAKRIAMLAAREAAMKSGTVTKVGGNHV